ncbi:hypothetical protein UY3_18362 [Chelonia mydas]|uniref:Uncharacterized protein n=1 Tax=Chelonia mydas TaxID=8469 RepID=M7AXR0_CHEMY|nr:hypothetical protein UY3_18362 [Chelonia mydas]
MDNRGSVLRSIVLPNHTCSRQRYWARSSDSVNQCSSIDFHEAMLIYTSYEYDPLLLNERRNDPNFTEGGGKTLTSVHFGSGPLITNGNLSQSPATSSSGNGKKQKATYIHLSQILGFSIAVRGSVTVYAIVSINVFIQRECLFLELFLQNESMAVLKLALVFGLRVLKEMIVYVLLYKYLCSMTGVYNGTWNPSPGLDPHFAIDPFLELAKTLGHIYTYSAAAVQLYQCSCVAVKTFNANGRELARRHKQTHLRERQKLLLAGEAGPLRCAHWHLRRCNYVAQEGWNSHAPEQPSMEPAQITAAVMTVLNTTHIIQQYMQNLQKQASRRRQHGEESDEDMDKDFSQSTGPGNVHILVVMGQVHSVER